MTISLLIEVHDKEIVSIYNMTYTLARFGSQISERYDHYNI